MYLSLEQANHFYHGDISEELLLLGVYAILPGVDDSSQGASDGSRVEPAQTGSAATPSTVKLSADEPFTAGSSTSGMPTSRTLTPGPSTSAKSHLEVRP